MPTVSIIVPVFRVEAYLENCIRSLLNQTMKDVEIILVDDGSPDASGQICDRAAEEDPRVIVIHQKNQGVSVARNAGIEAASGKWLTFVDGDDWAHEDLCRDAVDCAEKNGADVVIFSYYSAFSDRNKMARLTDLPEGDVTAEKDYIIKKTISQYYGGTVVNNGVSAGTTWGKLIRRDLVIRDNIRFKRGLTRAQDTVFWLRGFESAQKIVVLDKALYYYRITNDSICSGTKYLPNCEVPFGMLLEEYRKFIKEYNKDQEFEKAYDVRAMQVMYWHVKHKILNAQNPGSAKEKIRMLRDLADGAQFRDSIRRVRTAWLPRSLKLLVGCFRARAFAPYYWAYRNVIARKDRTHS